MGDVATELTGDSTPRLGTRARVLFLILEEALLFSGEKQHCQICALKGPLAAGGGAVCAGHRGPKRSGPDGHMVRAKHLRPQILFQWHHVTFLYNDQEYFIVTNINRKPEQ